MTHVSFNPIVQNHIYTPPPSLTIHGSLDKLPAKETAKKTDFYALSIIVGISMTVVACAAGIPEVALFVGAIILVAILVIESSPGYSQPTVYQHIPPYQPIFVPAPRTKTPPPVVVYTPPAPPRSSGFGLFGGHQLYQPPVPNRAPPQTFAQVGVRSGHQTTTGVVYTPPPVPRRDEPTFAQVGVRSANQTATVVERLPPPPTRVEPPRNVQPVFAQVGGRSGSNQAPVAPAPAGSGQTFARVGSR